MTDDITVLYHVIDPGEPPNRVVFDRLPDEERSVARRFHCVADRRAYALSHWLMRSGLEAMGLPFDVALAQGPFGRPFVENSSIVFSMSRTREVAACAFSRGPNVGLDVESIHQLGEPSNLIPLMMTETECRRLDILPADRQIIDVLRTWTRKEAVLKAIGRGLNIAPDTFAVDLDTDRVACLSGLWRFMERQLTPTNRCALAMPYRDQCPAVTFQGVSFNS